MCNEGSPRGSLLLPSSSVCPSWSAGIVSTSIHPSFSLSPSAPSPSPPPRHQLHEPRGDRERETERERRRGTSSMDRSIDPTLFWRCSSLPPPPLSPQFLSSLRTLLSSFVPLFRRHRDYSERGADSHGLLPILCKFICMIRQYFVSLFI